MPSFELCFFLHQLTHFAGVITWHFTVAGFGDGRDKIIHDMQNNFFELPALYETQRSRMSVAFRQNSMYLIIQINRDWRSVIDSQPRRFALTVPVWLPRLLFARLSQPMRQKDLGALLSLNSSTVSGPLDRLELNQFVEQAESPDSQVGTIRPAVRNMVTVKHVIKLLSKARNGLLAFVLACTLDSASRVRQLIAWFFASRDEAWWITPRTREVGPKTSSFRLLRPLVAQNYPFLIGKKYWLGSAMFRLTFLANRSARLGSWRPTLEQRVSSTGETTALRMIDPIECNMQYGICRCCKVPKIDSILCHARHQATVVLCICWSRTFGMAVAGVDRRPPQEH